MVGHSILINVFCAARPPTRYEEQLSVYWNAGSPVPYVLLTSACQEEEGWSGEGGDVAVRYLHISPAD